MNFKIWLTLLAVAPSSHCKEDAECQFRGTFSDGHCLCKYPYIGANCEIDIQADDGIEACKEGPDAPVCSGRGSCYFGICHCNQRDVPGEEILGRFCDCTNFLCPRFNGLLCGGPDHGVCECNKCHCRPGWSGETCQCSTSDHNCKFPDSHDVCSNRGFCECNQCRCEEMFSGQFCQECPTCKGSCMVLKDCVYCQTFGGRHCPLGYDEYAEKCHLEIEMVDSLGEIGTDERKCQFFDREDCLFQFAYSNTARSWKIRSSRQRECPPNPDPVSVAEGEYECSKGQRYIVSSYMAREITPKRVYSWTFLAYDGKGASISCPFMQIQKSKNCKKNNLIISSPSEHKNAKKLCGDVTELSYSSNEGIAVSFQRRDDFTNFACEVVCDGENFIQPPSLEERRSVSTPRPVINSCADTNDKFLSECRCYNCGGRISLHCGLCNKKNIEAFEDYDFSVDIELELTTVCRSRLDLAGAFGPNASRIKSLKLCSHDAIRVNFSELANLEALALQDCHKSAFSICQINPMEAPARPLITAPREGASPSKEIVGAFAQIPKPEDVPKLNQLILTNVNLTVEDGSFDFPNLRKIIISSEGGLILKPNLFDRLSYLEVLSVKSCMNIFENDLFKFSSPFLKEVRIEDKCVHSIASGAVKIDSNGHLEGSGDGGSKIRIHLTFNEKYFDHIPMCPFRPMVEGSFTEFIWESELQCRSCGGIWYWDLRPSEYSSSSVTASCYDTVSESTLPLLQYVTHNEKLCSFQTGYLGTCI